MLGLSCLKDNRYILLIETRMEFLDNFKLRRPVNVHPFSSFDVKHTHRWTDILLAMRLLYGLLHKTHISRASFCIEKILTVQS
jgi:hypothetical protein